MAIGFGPLLESFGTARYNKPISCSVFERTALGAPQRPGAGRPSPVAGPSWRSFQVDGKTAGCCRAAKYAVRRRSPDEALRRLSGNRRPSTSTVRRSALEVGSRRGKGRSRCCVVVRLDAIVLRMSCRDQPLGLRARDLRAALGGQVGYERASPRGESDVLRSVAVSRRSVTRRCTRASLRASANTSGPHYPSDIEQGQ